jgi:hypothetical protein
MKQYLYLLLFISIFFPGCKKNKPAIDQLPPATQTGAGTFGCLVDGKVFKPKGDLFSGSIASASYQYLNSSLSKGYFFSVSATNTSTDFVKGISINTDSLPIKEGQTIILEKYGKKGAAAGQFSIIGNDFIFHEYLTTFSEKGELKITKFDSLNRIVSGTFWFDAINSNGEKVQVREGRFDMPYSL